MKPGRRAVGIAESYRGTTGSTSTLAGVVVRADRTVDDFSVSRCTVGGRDSTEAIIALWRRLDRPDVRYLFLAGSAPAWYNIVDLDAVYQAIDRPVLAVSFEPSGGLEAAIADAFDGDERDERLRVYTSLPERQRLEVGETDLFVRSVGIDSETTAAVVNAYTERKRPEPLRIAKRLARRLDAARRDGTLAPD